MTMSDSVLSFPGCDALRYSNDCSEVCEKKMQFTAMRRIQWFLYLWMY